MNFESYIQLASCLRDLFYPLVEVTLFDAKGSILEIFNAFSSLKEDQACDVQEIEKNKPYAELLSSGRSVRCLIHPLKNGKEIAGYLRLRYDLTTLVNLQDQLNFIVQAASSVSDQKTTGTWKESIDTVILEYHSENKINIQATTARQKRELISILQKKGLLDFKESSAYVASKLQVSRATVYNYLKTSAVFNKVHIHQVDAFTNKKFGGNPAGVVLDADALDESTMRKIARELNLSETSFVLPSKKGDFKLRYFTPTGHEISFCGHSTVGALYMLAKEHRYGIEKGVTSTFDVETLAGKIKMEASIDAKAEIHVAYEAPKILLREINITHEEVAHAAGFEILLIDPQFPVMYEATNKDLFIVIRSLKDLKKVECDARSLTQFCKKHDIVVLCLLTQEAFDKKNQFHMRCFAPLVGISEDPFTGSVLGGLAAYVDSLGLIQKRKGSFHVEQGHFMERPGVVRVEYIKKQGNYHAKVFAQAVHCFSTEINL